MDVLKDKVAIITGASRGIGKAMALLFARRGARVVLVARTSDALDNVLAEIRRSKAEAIAVIADLAMEEAIPEVLDAALAAFGRIDILVNNAAVIHPPMELASFDMSVWRKVLDVNLTAPALLTKAVLPYMIQQRSGKILNISSIGGRKGARGRSAYRATKAGLISLTESVAAEVKEYGIDVNCICPGGVDTEGLREAFSNRGVEDNPKLMRPEEIAELALFMVSEQCTAVTGTAVDAFGGSNPLFG